MKALRALFVICVLLLGAAQAQASITYTKVDMQGAVNSDLTTWYQGHGYPQNGGPLTVGGIDFQLATMPAYPGQPNNPGWWRTAVLHASENTSYPAIAANVLNPMTAYVLVNSSHGYGGTPVGNLAFQTASGQSYTYELVEGVNVRDHYANSPWSQTVTSPDLIGTATFYCDSLRLDAYAIALPPEFSASTLSGIIVTGYGKGEAGNPFLAAVTVASAPGKTPLPAAVWFFGSGLVGLVGLRKKFKA